MSCARHEEFRRFHQDSCRLCGTAHRYMNIDHDHTVGWSAVRGLLCAPCNAGHMRGIDTGEYAIDAVTHNYLIRPWHLARLGRRLPYEPRVHVSINDLHPRDLAELRRVVSASSPYGMRTRRPNFEHPGIAECVAHGDVRPLMRLRILYLRGMSAHDIADPDLYLSGFQRNYLPRAATQPAPEDRWAHIAADPNSAKEPQCQPHTS